METREKIVRCAKHSGMDGRQIVRILCKNLERNFVWRTNYPEQFNATEIVGYDREENKHSSAHEKKRNQTKKRGKSAGIVWTMRFRRLAVHEGDEIPSAFASIQMDMNRRHSCVFAPICAHFPIYKFRIVESSLYLKIIVHL